LTQIMAARLRPALGLSLGLRFQRVATPQAGLTALSWSCLRQKGSKASAEWVGLTNDQDFFAKNEKMSRPMSPHIFIYKWPMAAVMSIMHRASGAALTVGISAAAVGIAFGGLTFPELISTIKGMDLPAAVIFGAKFTVALPFAYHTCNGVRHLLWDSVPSNLSNDAVTRSSLVVLGCAGVLTAGLCML
jgi:succinate dehydrogenase (ubiquinone) cytochrome b560 subunit